MPQTMLHTALPHRTSLLARLVRALNEARSRRRERLSLARLDPHLLRDIGLARDEAATEAAKPFWQP